MPAIYAKWFLREDRAVCTAFTRWGARILGESSGLCLRRAWLNRSRRIKRRLSWTDGAVIVLAEVFGFLKCRFIVNARVVVKKKLGSARRFFARTKRETKDQSARSSGKRERVLFSVRARVFSWWSVFCGESEGIFSVGILWKIA